MKLRIINDGTHSEPMHHAIDQVLTEKLDNGEMGSTLRFWYRKNKAVPIGRFQSYQDEVQEPYILDNQIDVVRRITGGGAMYVAPGQVITYSMYMPSDQVPDDFVESYRELDAWTVRALQNLGVDAGHEPINDITHSDGKIGGSAQLRKQNAVLHHATLSYDLDIAAMLKALKIGKEKLSDKAVKSAEKRVTKIKNHVDRDREHVINAMIDEFKQEYGGTEDQLTDQELAKAEELAETKFSQESWTKRL